MTCRGFAISSSVPGVTLGEREATAFLEGLRRLEQWWSHENTDPQDANARAWGCRLNVDLEYHEAGNDPAGDGWVLVQLVAQLPPGTPPDFEAYHSTDEQGRPVALVKWSPNWTEAFSHEIWETREDATCQITVPLPDGGRTPREVCDWAQGQPYEEPTSPGVLLANAVGPGFFVVGSTGDLDIASDIRIAGIRRAFAETPDGYHEVVSDSGESTYVYGEYVTAAKRALLERVGPRGGKVRTRR